MQLGALAFDERKEHRLLVPAGVAQADVLDLCRGVHPWLLDRRDAGD
jgi:hypothetical protein